MRLGIILCDCSEKWTTCYQSICESCFKRVGDELTYFKTWNGEIPTLQNTEHLGGLVALGSAHMVSEKTEWMDALCRFYKQIEQSHLKVVALCFSHQLMNKAYGGTIATNRDFIFGSDLVRFRDDIPKSTLSALPQACNSWNLLKSHRDEVRQLPPGAQLIASSKRCTNEIVLVRPHILTLQGHPDLTPDLMMEKIWPALIKKKYVQKDMEMDARQQMKNGLDTDLCLEFITDFLRL